MLLRVAKRLLIALLLALPAIGALSWTCYPAARAAMATLDFEPVQLAEADWNDPIRVLELRRNVQRHFLEHSVYIPMEDIVASTANSSDTTSLLMQKACGQGRLFIWIPLKFHLPVTGEKVIEWCWKPQTSDA